MFIIYTIVVLLNCIIAALAELYDKKNKKLGMLFAGICAAVSFWTLCAYQVNLAIDRIFWGRMAFVGPIIIGWLAVLLVNYYLENIRLNKLQLLIIGIFPVIMLLLSPTSFILEKYNETTFEPVFNIGHIVFAIYIFIYFGIGVFLLYKAQKKAKEYHKYKLRYMLYGFLAAATGGLFFSLVLPLFQVNEFHILGPVFVPFFPIIAVIPEFRYKRHNFYIMLKHSIVYALFILSLGTIIFLAIAINSYVINNFNSNPLIGYIIISILILIIYNPMNKLIKLITNNLLHTELSNYQKDLIDFTQNINKMIDLKQILSAITQILPIIIKSQKIRLLLKDQNETYIDQTANKESDLLDHNSLTKLINIVEKNNSSLIKIEVQFQYKFSKDKKEKRELKKMLNIFDRQNINVILPINIANKLEGLLIISPKSKKQTYFDDDIVFLEIITNHLATAIQNAKLYSRLEYNKERLNILNNYCNKICGTFNIENILDKTTNLIKEAFGFNKIIISIQKPFFKNNENIYYHHEIMKKVELENLNLEDLIIEKAQNHEKIKNPFWAHDLLDNINKKKIDNLLNRYKSKYLFIIPLQDNNKIIGAIFCFSQKILKIYEPILSGTPVLIQSIVQIINTALNSIRLYQEVKETGEYNEEVLQNMIAGVIICDEKNEIIQFNKKAEDITSLKMAEVIGKNINTIFSVSQEFKIIEKTCQNRKSINKEIEIEKDGKIISYSAVTGIINILDTERVILILSDITPVKELQKEVENANRLSSLGRMAAGVAHEIKNPLVAIKTFTQLLPDKWQEKSFRTKYINTVGPQIERISKLCKSLLQLGQPNKMEFREVDMNEVIEEVKNLLSGEEKKLSASIMIKSNTKEKILVDKEQMVQVILNIVMNGLESLKGEGGEVTISLNENKEYLKINISDTGCGMSSEEIRKAIDPFYTTKDVGTGLGMTIVHRIVKEHKGKLELSSKPGEGSNILIFLPKIRVKKRINSPV